MKEEKSPKPLARWWILRCLKSCISLSNVQHAFFSCWSFWINTAGFIIKQTSPEVWLFLPECLYSLGAPHLGTALPHSWWRSKETLASYPGISLLGLSILVPGGWNCVAFSSGTSPAREDMGPSECSKVGQPARLFPLALRLGWDRAWGRSERYGWAIRGHFCNPGEEKGCLLFHLGPFILALS